jgi:hypothetical protein
MFKELLIESEKNLRNFLKKYKAENTSEGWILSNDNIKLQNILDKFDKMNDKGSFKNSSINEIIFNFGNKKIIRKINK